MASISSLTSSAAHFAGIQFSSGDLHHLPSRVTLRPLRVSAACATATSTATSSSHIATAGSLYEVLGIHTGASSGEIKSAYRKLARVCHPDVHHKENGAYEFMKIQEAYETLSDPEKRSKYDRSMFRGVGAVRLSSPYMTSVTAATMASYAAANGFSRSPRRRWETDQCW
ncbi:Chaperone protein DnaJ [Euphorbia peplus]|nr:Chaperone protein DnaJ [Euphorbia peplus]